MRILRCKDVIKKTGLPRTTIYDMVRDKIFPSPIQLGPRTTGWVEEEIEKWLLEKVRMRDEVASSL